MTTRTDLEEGSDDPVEGLGLEHLGPLRRTVVVPVVVQDHRLVRPVSVFTARTHRESESAVSHRPAGPGRYLKLTVRHRTPHHRWLDSPSLPPSPTKRDLWTSQCS